MRKVVLGSRVIATGISQTFDGMSSIVRSFPSVAMSRDRMTEADARVKVAELLASVGMDVGASDWGACYDTPEEDFKPVKAKIGGFEDDFEAFWQDSVRLSEDMREAKRRLTGVE